MPRSDALCTLRTAHGGDFPPAREFFHRALCESGQRRCHLDAAMVAAALEKIDLTAFDLIVIENVGNLVCPAEFALGEDAKAVVLSITEGDDKPLKYPLIFKESAAALLNKVDILPYTNFDMASACADIRALHPGIAVLPVSCRTGEGLSAWYAWLRAQAAAKKAAQEESR